MCIVNRRTWYAGRSSDGINQRVVSYRETGVKVASAGDSGDASQ